MNGLFKKLYSFTDKLRHDAALPLVVLWGGIRNVGICDVECCLFLPVLARAFPFLPDLPEVGGVRPRVTFSQGQLDQGLYPSPHAPVHLMSLCLVLLRNKPLYPPTPPDDPPAFLVLGLTGLLQEASRTDLPWQSHIGTVGFAQSEGKVVRY